MNRSSEANDAGLKEVEVSAAVHLAFDELQLADLAFGLPVGPRQGDRRLDCGFIFGQPLANAATRLTLALEIQASRSASAFWRMMPWNSRMISRASTRTATPLSIAATVIVSAFESRSRPTVRRRATVRADGARANAAGSALSAFFRRAPFAHDAKAASKSAQLERSP